MTQSVTLTTDIWIDGVLESSGSTISVNSGLAGELVSSKRATYVTDPMGSSRTEPVTDTRDDSGNVVGFTPSEISLPPKILINYHNGETGLVVAAGAAEAMFGPAIQIPAGLITPGCQLRMMCLFQQAAASNSSARRIKIKSAATEAGLLAGDVAHQYQTMSTTNVSYYVDKTGVVLDSDAGISQAVGVLGPTATTGAVLSLVFADLSTDSWMQFSVENVSDQAMTIYHAALHLLPAA